ncbi:hypothetical protein [Streptomyces sp. KMM 9044]|uniref:hypothetical protein n=1 Tax=Streptomyces sp. KMM 9044 TaxID=2744474 RepID=UPI0021515ED2|nr:hypothetical protein [Streptomyces sp. KMM 9044]WAX79588.1 hypothetical protein HUV60_019850 [Streptomyces sp. KMM 9044]
MGMKDQFQEKSERMKDQAKQKMGEAGEQHQNRGRGREEEPDNPQQRRLQQESDERREQRRQS